MSLFDRQISLRIEREFEGIDPAVSQFLSESMVGAINAFREAAGISADLIIEDLNVEFNIQRTNKKDPNTLLAKIYNLSEGSRNSITVKQGVTLNAGYVDNQSTIFVGDIRTVKHYRNGSDIITEIEAGDGEKAQRKRFNKSYSKNTAFIDIARDLAGFLGVGLGNVEETINSSAAETGGIPTTLKNGAVVSGYAINSLDRLLNSRGLEYSIQDNVIQVLAIGQPLQETVIELDKDSGLIGIPTVTATGVLTCDTLMVPGIFPGKRINISSKFAAEGDYKVLTVNYYGSLFSSEFGMTIEAKAL